MSIIKNIIGLVASFVHLIYNYKVHRLFVSIKDVFYINWIKHEFASCGENNFFGGFSFLCGQKHINLGSNLYIGEGVIWEVYDEFHGQKFNPSLSFGDGCSFGDHGHITCINKVEIGNGVRFGRKVFITDNSHGSSDRSQLDTPANHRPMFSKGPVIIKDNAWIGEMVCILPGVTIGKGSVIGAGSVVSKDIPDYCVAVGNPARIKRDLSQQTLHP